MSTDEICDELASLVEKRHVLEVLRDAFMHGISNQEILLEDYGILPEEIEWFYKEIVKEKDVPTSRLLPIIDKTIMDINARIREIMSEQIKGLKIYIFNNWRELIGSVWTGAFKGREIEKIEDDKVVLLAAKEIPWRGLKGEENLLIAGLGIYYCKFYMTGTGEAITFYEGIHGVLLPQLIMEKAKRSPALTYGRFSTYYRKYLMTIFLDYNLLDPEDVSQLKRLYTRTMYENLSIFERFLSAIRSEIKIDEKQDIKLLSAVPEFFNRIITSNKGFKEGLEKYKGSIPGLMGYDPGIDKLLDMINITDLDEILIILKDVKDRFLRFGLEILKDVLPR